MKNQKERRRRSSSAKGWNPPGGLSQAEIPLHYEDTGAQDLSHFLEGQTAALWDVHEEKHKPTHSEDIPALTDLTALTVIYPEWNKYKDKIHKQL